MRVDTQKHAEVSQGDIFRDIEMVELVEDNLDAVVVSRIIFPLVIVLTQDCDLAQDYTVRSSNGKSQSDDKKLLSVLVSPLYNLEQVFLGTHLKELDRTMQTISKNKTPGKRLINNETPRYHFLAFPDKLQLVDSVVDFKHYFSVSVETLEKKKPKHFVCRVGDLYREDISQRFASYLSRIALP